MSATKKRVMTPDEAEMNGSSAIVVGRAITQAQNPVEAYRLVSNFLEESTMKQTAKDLLKINAVKLSPKEPFTWASGIKSPIYCDNRLTIGCH